MNRITFQAFETEARAQGFNKVVERKWTPGMVVQSHTHPFSVRALVVQGEMWLTVGTDVRTCGPATNFLSIETWLTRSAMARRAPPTGRRVATVSRN